MSQTFVSRSLVGRIEQRAAQAHLLDQSRRGTGAVVLFTDEAGIGKSRLVADAGVRLAATRDLLHGQDFTLSDAVLDSSRKLARFPIR